MTEHTIHPTSGVLLSGSASIAAAGPPHTYLEMARHFMAGLRPLLNAGATCALPLAFLSAQVAECALKAYLSRSGDDKRLKEKSLRHNLSDLWSLAAQEGLAVPKTPPRWLEQLSTLHNAPYYLRYSTGVHAMVGPGPEPMTTELEALVFLVGSSL